MKSLSDTNCTGEWGGGGARTVQGSGGEGGRGQLIHFQGRHSIKLVLSENLLCVYSAQSGQDIRNSETIT